MDPIERRNLVVEHLEANYLGPIGGQDEWLRSKPGMTYLVGTLYAAQPVGVGADGDGDGDGGVDPEDDDGVIESANGWHPSSAAMSFLHDGTQIECSVSFGTYSEETIDGERGWRRIQHGPKLIPLSRVEGSVSIVEPAFSYRVSSRWRAVGDEWLVTVALENLRSMSDENSVVTEDTLFQIELRATPVDGSIQPYRTTEALGLDDEEQELALRYRSKRAFAVGHGIAVEWDLDESGRTISVRTEALPKFEVAAIDARESSSAVVSLQFLATCDTHSEAVCSALDEFVSEYSAWIVEQRASAADLDQSFQQAASRILKRAEISEGRMREGITVLRETEVARHAFALAMVAMREQMLQSRHVRKDRGNPTRRPSLPSDEPRWRPFQLGFLLLCLPSLIFDDHDDRDLVDLIWFPTGGGKTEAYLALAAIEIFRRRLTSGVRGGGTAVLTRYTLRLLTTQQFQRAATLICAMEKLRSTHDRVKGMQPFTIGLWVGNETTPSTIKDAKSQFDATVKKKNPDNPFQLEACPWCGTSIMPARRSDDLGDYGVLVTPGSVALRCRLPECDFRAGLPVEVIDERIYAEPPTIVLATVDKFARLPFNDRAGRILGRAVPFNAPSLIIQDELHLLSGPLGTTVGLYETAVLGLIEMGGQRPKIVASTATIRAAENQIAHLFARQVELYPAAGLDEEDSYFAKASTFRPGRLYVGLMPQAFTQSTAVVRGMAPLLEGPHEIGSTDPSDMDAYWTVVAYHNSLRELGRTVTLVRDDVNSLLRARRGGDAAGRSLRGDGLVELTSRVSPEDLPRELGRLETAYVSGNAVDVVASTNMLSVGIDVPRLAVMLMNGQPKTTSEYIQATSRVGRGDVPGIVVTLFRATKPRDRSHYEIFRAYHQSLYRSVEPTSVTPWSLSSRRRSLPGVLVAFMRHGAGLSDNLDAARFDTESMLTRRVVAMIQEIVDKVDPDEADETRVQLKSLLAEWKAWADDARLAGGKLAYDQKDGPALLKDFGEARSGWPVMSSMRNVDRVVRVVARGEE